MKLYKFSSYHIKNDALNLASEHPYSEENFERKFQANLFPYNQINKQPGEELIEFKG